MSATKPTGIEDTATTSRWDTVFAMHIDDVNRAIASRGSSPAGFDVTDADARDGGLAASGEFGAWQIATGGDSKLVKLAIPLRNVVIRNLDAGDITVPSAVVSAGVHLNFLLAAETAGNGDRHHLKVSTRPGVKEDKVVDVTDVTFDDPHTSERIKIALITLADQWLNAHLHEFDHVFATIDLNSTADKGQFQWLLPTAHEYAYTDLDLDGRDGALAILCMTQNRSADGLQPEVSSVAILPGQRAGFLISKERIIEQLLMPVMPKMFTDTSGADFKLSDTGGSILNAHDRMSFTVKDDDGKTHTARIISLSLTIIAGELQMDLVTQTDLSAGIRANCHTQTFLGIKLVNNSAGEQTLGFCDARPPLIEHSTDADSGFSVAEEVLIVVALIAAAVAVVATAGTALALGAIIIGIVAGIGAAGIALSTNAIQLAGNDDAPSISAALLTATAPIIWADSADFKLTAAQLNDSLQLSGYPQFALDGRAQAPSAPRGLHIATS